MKSLSHQQPQVQGGFALVSVLLVLVILTIMVVAFLQSVRIDRLTARAYLNKAQAEMVAQSATQLAISDLLDSITLADGSQTRLYTTELHNNVTNDSLGPVVTTTRWEQPTEGTWVSYTVPLISKLQNNQEFETDFASAISQLYADRADNSKSIDLNRKETIKVKDGTHDDAFQAVLKELRDSSGTVIGRYAYVIVDEQSKLNPSIHTGQPRDNFGETAAEIPISLGSEDNTFLNTTEQEGFSRYFSAFEQIQSPFSIGQAFSSPNSDNPSERAHQKQHLFSYYSAPNEDIIPAPYPDAGKPKYNINDLAIDPTMTSTQRAETIANIIDRNLPDFKFRDPTFEEAGSKSDSIKYVHRIAASIVDYIDSDNTATSVNGGEPAGKDLSPMVCALAENIIWINKGVAPNYTCQFSTQYYVQLWNPYSTPITGKATVEVLERPELLVGNAIDRALLDYKESVVDITIRPNEFLVVEFPSLQEEDRNAGLDADNSSERPSWLNTSSTDILKQPHPYFKFYWDDVLVDITRRSPIIADVSSEPSTSGLPKGLVAKSDSNINTFKVGRNRWSTHFMPIRFSSSDGFRRIPDPRANYISNYDWIEWLGSSYSNGKWGGRQDHASTQQDFVDTLIKRDIVRVNPNLGNASSDTTKTPKEIAEETYSTAYDPSLDSLNAPFYIRNAPMKSIGELGHIFDPVQASDTGDPGNPKGSNGSGVGVFSPGGGRQLRMGQPEPDLDTNPWDIEGKRAIQLTDLFTTSPVPAIEKFPIFTGRININTAPQSVLASLFFNISADSDEGLYSGDETKIPKITNEKASSLVNLIITERETNGPFNKISDLHRLTSLWNRADIYSPNLGDGLADATPKVMDRAREELFSKVVNLITTQSRAFKVHVAGQSLDANGQTTATSLGEAVVELTFTTNQTTNKTQVNHQVTFSRFQ